MVFEVFRRLTPLIAHCAECGLTPDHQQKIFHPLKIFLTLCTSQPLRCDLTD